MTQDFKELLNIFNRNGVRYLIVGGYAVMKYTEPRFTKDLDIWIEASFENARKVFLSLFFTSMLTSQWALDNGSFVRLKWHIKKIANELK